MQQQTREKIEKLVNKAWQLHDEAQSEIEKEAYKLDIMELLSQLPENTVILKVMQ